MDTVSNNILKLYPPKKYAYIMLGNSPALVTEYIHQEANEKGFDVTLLPLSLSEVSMEGYLESVEKELYPTEDDEVTGQDRLNMYFAQYVSPEALKGKIPLLVDLAASGQSLAITATHLKRYYAKAGDKEAATKLTTASLGSGDERRVYVDKDFLKEAEDEEAPFVSQILGPKGEKNIDVGGIQQLDPEGDAVAFTDGILNRKFKDGFGYKTFERTEYELIMSGEVTKSEWDDLGLKRAREDVYAIRSLLKK